MPETRSATLYRMVLPDHVCPYGLRARQLLLDAGYQIDDRELTTRIEVEALMDKLGVETTPQIFIDGERIGGCEELEAYLVSAGPSAYEKA